MQEKDTKNKIRLVIDANILIAALIKDGITAELLFENRLILYTPEFILEEFSKYQKLILRKTTRTAQEFVQIMHTLQSTIRVKKQDEYEDYLTEATNISPDEDDAIYFALSLRMNCPIWSNDKALKLQDRVKIINTKELIEILRKEYKAQRR